MKTKSVRTHRAFTLIELLVVIAIIAILASILFPVFALVREQARQSSTMSNMQAVYIGAKLYNEDEGHYPAVLYDYAEATDITGLLTPAHRPVLMSDMPNMAGSKVVPMNAIAGSYKAASGSLITGYLYHEQIKDYVTFRAGDDGVTDPTQVTVAYYPPFTKVGGGQTGPTVNVGSLVMVTWNSTPATQGAGCPFYGDSDLPALDNTLKPFNENTPKMYYKMDAMDIGPMIDGNGDVVMNNNSVVYELHYSPDWTHTLWSAANNCDQDANKNPLVNQLKYKNPPSDSTVLTYVTSHVGFGHSSKVLVLLLSGTAKKMEAKDAVQQLPLQYKP